MTSIGFPRPGVAPDRGATRTVPLAPPALEQEDNAATTARPVPLRQRSAPPSGWVRIGTVQVGPVIGYLAAWAAVVFAVVLAVLVVGYLMLWALGVLSSVSAALAIVLGEPLEDGDVLPVLEPQSVLPLTVLVAFVSSVLAFASAFAAVLVHNAVASLSGGLLLRMRATGSPDAIARGRHVAASARVDLRRSGDS